MSPLARLVTVRRNATQGDDENRAEGDAIKAAAAEILREIHENVAPEKRLGIAAAYLALTRAAGNHNALLLAELRDEVQRLKDAQHATLADSYKGTWLPGNYERGALVTHGGSCWLAVERCDGKPGISSGWRLIVKRGRDDS